MTPLPWIALLVIAARCWLTSALLLAGLGKVLHPPPAPKITFLVNTRFGVIIGRSLIGSAALLEWVAGFGLLLYPDSDFSLMVAVSLVLVVALFGWLGERQGWLQD